jgi:predicted site-specific integrase-resolvase
MKRDLPYPPPFQDVQTLCAHLCISEATVDNWTRLGILPPPVTKEGKRLWQWTKVVRHLEGDKESVSSSPDTLAERIRNATRSSASR